jgi:hypothetical protein
LGPKSFATSGRAGRPDEYTDKPSPFGHAGDGMVHVADTQTLFATRSPVRSVRHFSPLFTDSVVSWRSQALNQTS